MIEPVLPMTNLLWLMVCNIEDRRVARRAKHSKQVAATSSRLAEGAPGVEMAQMINQMAVAYPEGCKAYL